MRARDEDAGFTLVELMVVIAIIGMAAGAVVLSMPSADGSVRRAAEALAVDAAAARDHAIIAGRRTTLTTDAAGFAFLERRGGVDAVPSDRRFRGGPWPDGVVASAVRLRFDPTGIADGGRIVLTGQAGGGTAMVDIAADGRIHVTG